MQQERSLKTLTLDGGALPFHLVNTVYAWRGENLHEYLNSYADVLAWSVKVGLLKATDLRRLKETAATQPATAEKAFQKIIATRALLYKFFSAVAAGDGKVLAKWLPQFNALVQEAFPHFLWSSVKGKLFFAHGKELALLLPLWLVVKAAHDLLRTEDLARIKECPLCGWIFLDTTKNGKRRWCNPQSCGSIDKAKRYYHKKVKAASSE